MVKKLTPKMLRFCSLYLFDIRCFGNATRSYMQAYRIKIPHIAQSAGSRLLKNKAIRSHLKTARLFDSEIKYSPEEIEARSLYMFGDRSKKTWKLVKSGHRKMTRYAKLNKKHEEN